MACREAGLADAFVSSGVFVTCTSLATLLRRWLSSLTMACMASAVVAPAAAAPLPLDLGQRLTTGYIQPAAAALRERSGLLHAELQRWCEAGAPADARSGVEGSFHATLAAWGRVEFLTIGPPARNTSFERISSWPDAGGTMPRLLGAAVAAADPAWIAPGGLKGKPLVAQGLPALEYLLFSVDFSHNRDAVNGAYRCTLATVIADNVHTEAGEIERAWLPQGAQLRDFARDMTPPPPPPPGRRAPPPSRVQPAYRTPQDVAGEMLRTLATGLHIMTEAKLAPMMGTDADDARPELGPFWRSGATAAYLAASVRGMGDFMAAARLVASEGTGEGRGLSAAFFEDAKRAETNLLDVAGVPLPRALSAQGDRQHFEAANAMAERMRLTLVERIAPAFGTTAAGPSVPKVNSVAKTKQGS